MFAELEGIVERLSKESAKGALNHSKAPSSAMINNTDSPKDGKGRNFLLLLHVTVFFWCRFQRVYSFFINSHSLTLDISSCCWERKAAIAFSHLKLHCLYYLDLENTVQTKDAAHFLDVSFTSIVVVLYYL